MSELSSNPDSLDLKNNAGLPKMITKQGGSPDEKVLLSVKVTKFSRKDKAQLRGFLVTDNALYTLSADDFTKGKRRVPIEKIQSITASASSEEFVLHIPDEYNYALLIRYLPI